jgi:hypothetical protein
VASAQRPSVGLFWVVPDADQHLLLLVTGVELARAGQYGGALTDLRGHHDVWEQWQRLSPKELKKLQFPISIKAYPYDHWPRGRVVYEIPASQFVIYADRRLHRSETIDRIVKAFALSRERVTVRADDHYRT